MKIKKAFIIIKGFIFPNFFVEWPNSLSYLTLKGFLKYYHKYFKNKNYSVLDVGSGDSPFSNLFNDIKKLDYYKISKQYDFKAKLDYNQDICGDISNIQTKFDIILCTDVLEHLKDPQKALDNMFSLLITD